MGRAGTAKACILLYMTGGPAQHETFDPKPDAPDGIRGDYRPIATTVPGTQICELLPMMAAQAHRYSILRSVHHGSDTHGVGVHYNLTGMLHAPRRSGEPQLDRRDWPCVGSVVRQLRGDRNGIPAAVQLPRPVGDQNNAAWGGQHAGFLGPPSTLFFFSTKIGGPAIRCPGSLPRRTLTHIARLPEHSFSTRCKAGGRRLHPPNAIMSGFKSSPSTCSVRARPGAFALDDEPRQMLDRYGDNRFGRSCLVARRLIERGVAFVTVPWMFKQSEQNFDTHSRNFTKMRDFLLPPVDRAFSALIEDLTQRGMLDETLLAWTGEFGRTPRINGSGGRDHWGRVYSTVLAGGGVRGGHVIGRSDAQGGVPASIPCMFRISSPPSITPWASAPTRASPIRPADRTLSCRASPCWNCSEPGPL